MKVLVADDDRAIALALQMALEDLGHDVLVAEDGRTAWELFRREGADAIISDWRMPGLEGPDLCRLVRSLPAEPYVYFVMLTVLSEPRHVLEGMQAGADDYLTKPISLDALQARLIAAERVTGLHRALLARRQEIEQAANERQRLLERLERERSQLETIIRQLPAGVLIASAPSGEIVMVNDQLRQLWPSAQLMEGNALDLRRAAFHQDGRPYEAHEWPPLRSMQTGEVITAEEMSILGDDGSTIILSVSAAPIPQTDHVSAVVVVVEDVTEQRRRQQQAAQSEKLRALGQLAGGVAHDLNQSLTLVAGYADVALMSLDEQRAASVDELRDMLRIVAQAAYDGGETVKQLLTFGRSAPDDRPPEEFDTGSLLREVARLTAPRWRDAAQAQGRPITLTVEAEPALMLEGWPASLREALTNLIFNAVDALPGGGAITVDARADEDVIVVSVTDSGVGMPPQVQERILEPYFTTKGEHGTGLGLPMVFGIVERHRGSLQVESAVGRGTTISLRLPRSQTPRQPALRRARTPTTVPRRILAVDDEAGVRLLVQRVLEGDGHTVVVVASAEEALTHLQTSRFDLLISDIGLGAGMNGWELVDRARAHDPAMTLMLVSGWGATIEPAEAAARGVQAVLPKPYRLADLRRAISEMDQPAGS